MAENTKKSSSGAAFGHLKLRHLNLLLLLETEGSITAAATAMNLSQPAVSSMLREMESIFGIRMVERSPRGVTLTAGARAARRRFATALAELGTVQEEARLAEQSALKRLRVGAMAVAAMGFLPRVMPIFLSGTERAQVQVVEGTIDNLTGLLINGELDCVIGRLAQNWEKSTDLAGQIKEVRLFDDPRCVVCRAGHPVMKGQPLSLAALAEEDWILPPAPSSSRVLFDQLFFDAGMSPPVPIIESASVQSNMETVATTDLLSVVALGIARRTIAAGNLQQLQIAVDFPPMPLSFLWRPTGDMDELVQSFLRAAMSAVANTAALTDLAK